MLDITKIISVAITVLIFFAAGISFAQEDSSKSHMNHDHKMEMNKDDHKDMDHDKIMKDNKSIIHEGEIDLADIDENGDGNVYQDQMCWNVLSDSSGECPQCGMILKEVSLEDARKNLEENGYEVK